MRRLLLALTLLLTASSGFAREQDLQVALLNGGLPWREARRIVEEHGGRLVHILPPDVLIGSIPPAAALALAAADADAQVVGSREDAQTLLSPATGQSVRAVVLSTEARAALMLLANPRAVPDDTLRLLPDGSVQVRPPSEWEDAPLMPPTETPALPPDQNAIGNTFWNTGDFLGGDVGVAIVRPESNGVSEASTENWTAGEVTSSLNAVLGALSKLSSDAANGRVTFIYRTESIGAGVAGTVTCDWEAIKHANWTANTTQSFLGYLGYTDPNAWTRLHEWVNDVRTDLGTDWAYGFVIVDNSADTSQGRASAYFNGPAAWLFQSNGYTVFHHESGHSWGARDEYHPDAAQSPIAFAGYTQEPNANSQYNDGTGFFGGAGESVPALMISNIDYVSPWARGAWGTWDLDGDGIYEPEDTRPTVSLNAPTGTTALTFTGTATASFLKLEAGALADTDITINRISRVDWRLNGGPWQNASASDGTFNASSEGFTFTTPTLPNGGYVFETRASDNFGNTATTFTRRDAVVTGSGLANGAPLVALSVTPTLGSTTTVFALSAAGSLDIEDGATGLQYRWDYTNDGTYDTGLSASATTTQTYGSAGTKTAKVEVRDALGAVTTRTITFTVAAANVVPTATFTVDKGMKFGTSPVVFNFDAGAVSDGEDAPGALQVRWDFDDDGTWDTSFSTTKTASHDYAQAYAFNASNETGNTYLYNGNSVNGYAQSFIAGTNGIGKAELYLTHLNDNTPGGTVTVGIRSSLTGAFLTSVVKNQVDLADGNFNTFDFPDIAVTSGATYYLVMILSDTDLMWLASTANPYASGQHHYSFNGGSSWTTPAAPPASNYDHVFRVYDSVLSTVPLTKSRIWRARMEVKDANNQTSQAVRDVVTNAYDTPPTVSLGVNPTSGTAATQFDFTATGADANSASVWDNMVHYRWDVDNDGNFESEFDSSNLRSDVTYARSGIYQATVEVRDRYHATARATVAVTVAPTLTAVSVADTTPCTPSAQVTLTAGALPEEMLLSESNVFAGATWVPYRPVANFTFAAATGTRTVFVKVRSGVGNESAVQSGSFTYTGAGCGSPPAIFPAGPLARTAGTAGSSSTIATVTDAETPAGSLVVTTTSVPAGLSVSGITNTAGTITATVAATCAATVGANSVGLLVTDATSQTAAGTLTVNVAANPAPTLGTYAGTSLQPGGSTTVTPTVGPADNGTFTLAATSPTYTGGLSVSNATGVVTLTGAAPTGTHTITVTVTDNCGTTFQRSFSVSVGCANESVTVADGRRLQTTLGPGANALFQVATTQDRSYSVEVSRSFDHDPPTTVTVLGVNDACGPASTLTTDDTSLVSPEASNGIRKSFVSPASGVNRVRITNSSGSAVTVSVSVAETTLYSAAWSTNGDFDTYYSLQNTTNAVLTGTIRLLDASGAQVGSAPVTIAAGATTGVNTASLGVPRGLTGVALFSHNGPPGGVLATAAVVNFTTVPAYVQYVKFRTLREQR